MTSKKLPQTLPACPVETTLLLIGSKWNILILRDLMDGTKRFGELQRSIGSISQKVLTSNLRDLEAKGVVDRKVYPECGILSNRTRTLLKTNPGFHVGLGRTVPRTTKLA